MCSRKGCPHKFVSFKPRIGVYKLFLRYDLVFGWHDGTILALLPFSKRVLGLNLDGVCVGVGLPVLGFSLGTSLEKLREDGLIIYF